jgi:hypothetical protein
MTICSWHKPENWPLVTGPRVEQPVVPSLVYAAKGPTVKMEFGAPVQGRKMLSR